MNIPMGINTRSPENLFIITKILSSYLTFYATKKIILFLVEHRLKFFYF